MVDGGLIEPWIPAQAGSIVIRGNKEGGKSLDVGGKRDGRLLPIHYTSIADI